MQELITIKNCSVVRGAKTVLRDVSWTMREGEAWLVTGRNGGGKSPFLEALAGTARIVPHSGAGADTGEPLSSYYLNTFKSMEMVSLERAAKLIQEERERDDSEYLDGGVDNGRTGEAFIAEALVRGGSSISPSAQTKKELERAECRVWTLPEVRLCGIEGILDRGIKYMSTGEIRRTLLCRALVGGAECLILSDPFAGLDAPSRALLYSFFGTLAAKQVAATSSHRPYVILGMERYTQIPDAITHVLEFTDGKVSFCGGRADYEAAIKDRASGTAEREAFKAQVQEVHKAATSAIETDARTKGDEGEPLIEMNHVNVGWDGNMVLRDLTWRLWRGEHWLIRGPNGSGKTTFLELITGDNGQVYANDVRMFGSRRGSGETIWEIKARLGIVSYRLHVEYRMVGGTSILDTVVSGLRDSIGLYGAATDVERASAMKWLHLTGFAGRETESFESLSYGEQRSILILRAAVKCPEVLILDEPCHGLSEEARCRVLEIMETVAESGMTTLLHVTHEEDEVLDCEHHILELHPDEVPMYKIMVR